MITSNPKEIVNKLKEEMKSLEGRALLITLFGSSVKGNITPLSDIDIAILPKEDVDELLLVGEVLRAITRALSITEDKVNVLLLNRVSSIILLYEAIVKGLPIYYENRSLYVEIRDKILSQYLDFEVFRRKLRLSERYLNAISRKVRA